MRILFVCTGNTCRSPMAAGLFAARFPGAQVASAGLAAEVGAPAAANAVAVMAALGIDIAAHRARTFTPAMGAGAVVAVMSAGHAAALERMGVDPAHIRVLGVPDPYGGDRAAYEAAAARLSAAIDALGEELGL